MFSSSERLIFKFDDGGKQRAIDPLAAFRKLHSYPGLSLVADVQAFDMLTKHFAKLEKDPAAADSPVGREVQTKGLEAWDRLLAAARSAFGVEPFHLDDNGAEVGMTDTEVMGLFMRLIDYCGALKKNTDPNPTSPPTTAPTS